MGEPHFQSASGLSAPGPASSGGLAWRVTGGGVGVDHRGGPPCSRIQAAPIRAPLGSWPSASQAPGPQTPGADRMMPRCPSQAGSPTSTAAGSPAPALSDPRQPAAGAGLPRLPVAVCFPHRAHVCLWGPLSASSRSPQAGPPDEPGVLLSKARRTACTPVLPPCSPSGGPECGLAVEGSSPAPPAGPRPQPLDSHPTSWGSLGADLLCQR